MQSFNTQGKTNVFQDELHYNNNVLNVGEKTFFLKLNV